jgi:hypothetical protein
VSDEILRCYAVREAVARHLADEEAAARGALPYGDASWACVRGRWLPRADAILALPALAPLRDGGAGDGR